MSSDSRFEFTKDNIDVYLKALAKAYRKHAGKNMPAEIILVGGASILINYGFRNMTTGVDAIINSASVMKDALNYVRDQYDLPDGWLNSDFMITDSYTDKLSQFSVYYKTFSNVVTVRTIDAEYLIAMKLRSGRQYKSDLSDVLGILSEHVRRKNGISLNQIVKAVIDLYGNWNILPETSRLFIENVMRDGRFDYLYEQILAGEKETRSLLIHFENSYKDVLNKSNVDVIAEKLQKKADKATILSELNKKKAKTE